MQFLSCTGCISGVRQMCIRDDHVGHACLERLHHLSELCWAALTYTVGHRIFIR